MPTAGRYWPMPTATPPSTALSRRCARPGPGIQGGQPPGAHPRAGIAQGPGWAAQGAGYIPIAVPHAHLLLGDWHRQSVLGPERAENISPTGWVLQQQMMFGTHHDAPVALPDSMRVLSATVTRKSRSGRVLGRSTAVPVATALKAMTIWPAWQHFEEDNKGQCRGGQACGFRHSVGQPAERAAR